MDLPPPLPPPWPGPLTAPAPGTAPRKRPAWPWVLAALFVSFAGFGAFVIYRVAVGPVGQAFTDGFQRGFNRSYPPTPSRNGSGRREADAPSRKDADARRPIVVAPGTGLHADDVKRAAAWTRRNVLDAYATAGRRDPRWDGAARDFLSRALPTLVNAPDAPEPAALLPAVNALLRAGCDDPAVLLLAGRLHAALDPESVEAGPLLARAVEGFKTAPYPRAVARLAAGIYAEDCEVRINDGTGKSDAPRRLQLAWFEQSLTDNSYRNDEDDQIVLAQHYANMPGNGFFESNRAACCRALEAAGEARVAPWVRHYLSGKRHLADAWEARGGGYSNTVSPAGWRGFAGELSQARQDLVRSWQLNPRRPEAATILISVTMGETSPPGGETERLWFDRATAAQFDYGAAYDKLLWALRPRWGGSQRAMLEFGAACADTGRFDTAVPSVLAQAARDVGDERENYYNTFNDRLVASRFEPVYAGYTAAPGLSRSQRREWSSERVLCGLYQDRFADAYRELASLDYQLAPETCRRWRERDSQRATDSLAIRVSPAHDQLLAAEQAERAGQRERAVALYRAVLADPAAAADPRVARYGRGQIAALELSTRLAATPTVPARGDDGWLPFLPVAPANAPNGELPGWEVKQGRWRVEPEGTLRGTAGARGMMLVSEAAVGPDWEWRGDVEPVSSTNGEWQAGVVFGYPGWTAQGRQWRSVRLKHNPREGEIATVGQTFARGPVEPVKLTARNHLVVQSWHGRVNVFVNGRSVLTEPAPAPKEGGWVDRPDARVGFGGYADDNRAEVRFRDVQLRRLVAEPAPPTPAGTAAGRQVSR